MTNVDMRRHGATFFLFYFEDQVRSFNFEINFKLKRHAHLFLNVLFKTGWTPDQNKLAQVEYPKVFFF